MYRIQYKDNTYQIVDWTEEEFKNVCKHKANNEAAAYTKKILVDLQDVRTIVFIPPTPPPTEKEKIEMKEYADSQLNEWGFVDMETLAWLRANGIDVTKKDGEN